MKNFILIMFLTFVNNILGQNKIEGQIISDNNEILPFSNIRLKQSSIGTYSNSEGKFILNFDEIHLKDTLVVSHIGFNDYENILKTILENNTVNFKLQESSIELDEIILENINSKEISKNAFSKLNTNHLPQNYDVFFRSYESKDGVWRGFIEASLLVENAKLSFEKENISIYVKEIRKSKDLFKSSNTKVSPYSNFKYLLLFNPNRCNYSFKGVVKQNGRDIYQISFISNNNVFEGNLFIDKKTHGFYKIAYKGTEKSNSKYRKRENEINGEKVKTYLTYGKWEVEMTFRNKKEKFEFESIKYSITRNTFNRKNKSTPLFVHNIIAESYFSESTGKPKDKSLLSPGKNIYELEKTYDPAFWEKYNAVIRDSLQASIINLLEEK
ncbi:carboxypeptidase-like regulatory domain-containing protein [Gaetbulibacter sp. M240]|uniref:carboxypeptidase-like regulatory domain-containing protein n=1 Tax=Gaetbulibacter sp. M240 TaxID=3126511 RepID=UPI00374E8121